MDERAGGLLLTADPARLAVIGTVLGRVLDSRHPDFRAGDLVRAWGQWGELSVVRPDEIHVERVSWQLDDLRQHLGVFGANGWTAYLGVTEFGAARSGDTVVVSAASGVTGALAGQIALRLGCHVVGITGSAEKAAWLTGELGFHDAIDRHDDVAAALRAVCPQGIDVYFDNVGGAVLTMAFEVTEGLEETLTAYGKLFTGDKLGKALVQVADPHEG